MALAMTLLKMEPEDTLLFCKTPAQSQPTGILKLTNISNGAVAFILKTTAPKSYLLSESCPNGTLRPGESEEVQIILQPQGGSDGGTNNHRFLVQAVPTSNVYAEFFKQWAECPKDKVQEHRLNVVLEDRNVEDSGAATKPEQSSGFTAGNQGSNDTPTDLKVKYDELVQYTLMLEKENSRLEDIIGFIGLCCIMGVDSEEFITDLVS